ncbi:MAG: hypothetical protein M3O28_02980, partial [Actinomycetota bacterium]|nr:hypothetical protein [Actinomycetota bacterium]
MHETDVATPPASPGTAPIPVAPVPVVLNPATRLLWRDHHAVQLELGARAVVVEGAAPEALQALASAIPAPLDPSDSRVAAARRVPAAGARTHLGDRAIADLVRGGFVWARRARESDPDPRLHP